MGCKSYVTVCVYHLPEVPRQLTKPSQRTPPSPSPRRRAPSESLLDGLGPVGWVLAARRAPFPTRRRTRPNWRRSVGQSGQVDGGRNLGNFAALEGQIHAFLSIFP